MKWNMESDLISGFLDPMTSQIKLLEKLYKTWEILPSGRLYWKGKSRSVLCPE